MKAHKIEIILGWEGRYIVELRDLKQIRRVVCNNEDEVRAIVDKALTLDLDKWPPPLT